MIHEMKLQNKPFNCIKAGTKIYELRLYDDKRRQIKIKDIINFTNMISGEKISVEVEDLLLFKNFKELFSNIDKKYLGYTDDEIADSKDMDQYYSIEEQNSFGVIAIKINLINNNINKIELYIPSVEDYWYEAKLQADPETMSYNAGYDVTYYGYHYDTGCIDFPKDKWQESYDKRRQNNKFFAYLKDCIINEYVGYVNYHYNKFEDRYYCGVLIEAKHRGKGYAKQALTMLCNKAKEDGIKELYDDFEVERGNALDIFKAVGFEVVEVTKGIKFNKQVDIVVVKKVL